jgi:D-alanyl-D-alanine carboxypeptidase (penicillin-binding protein 5/6)
LKQTFLIAACLAALAPVAFALAAPPTPAVGPTGTNPAREARAEPRRAPLPSAATAPVSPQIPVALLVDLSSHQILFAREAGRRFMPASVTKVMTAYTAFKLIAEGKLKEAAPVPITQELEEEWSGEGSSMFLKEGQRPTVGQLIMGSTTVSGNDATVALAIAATGSVANWTALMNVNAAELGMRESYFFSPNGYPDEGRTFTTAHDLALLAAATVTRYPALYERYFGNHGLSWSGITQANHDPITGRVEGADGLKTGYTNEAGYTFVGSAERGGRRLIMVLAGAPSGAVRNQAARELIEWGFDRFGSRPLFAAGTLVGEAQVQDGMAATVMLRAPASGIAAAFPQGAPARPALSIRYRGPLEAPIEEGEAVAHLRVENPGFEPVDIPLEAAEPVERANAWYRLVNGLYGLFG